jgi:Ca2+-binding RTX toxin-like protein
MQISSYVPGVSPDFSITRNEGRTVTLSFHYDLSGFYDEETGVDLWDGEIGSQLGPYGDYVHQTADRPMDLTYWVPLTAGPTHKFAGSYYLNDAHDGTSLVHEFTVTILDAANGYVGTSKADYVFGSDGTDAFHFVGEGDIYAGGGGTDFYYIESESDRIIELGGDNYVITYISYQLGAGVSVTVLKTYADDVTNINLTGNELTQYITGNAGNNILKSNGGGDTLYGVAGDDTYIVRSGDKVIEYQDGGFDRVKAEESYALNNCSVEFLTTILSTETTKIDLTGNKFSQEIVGNYGENVLHDGGAGGADTLRGLAGNDTYRVFNSGDVIVESAAQGLLDKLVAAVDYALGSGVHIEIMTTNGSTGTSGIDLTGNDFAQTIFGNAGANTVNGKGGNDTLTSGGGNDILVFDTALNDAANVDTITDYDAAADVIHIDNAVFSALTATGALAASAFRDIAAAPKDADDRIIYNSGTGNLYYDADGSGSAFGNIKFAHLANLAELTAADFVVI